MAYTQRALFVGRFQPFHNGHLKALKWILKQHDEIVIAIGSSQRSFDADNLFTAGERVEMIYRVLKAERIAQCCLIAPIPDIQNNAIWVAHVNSIVPKYSVVFSNNALVKRLFAEEGTVVESVPFFERREFDGTRIRKAMLEGGRWREFVPEEVESFVLEANALERLKAIATGDKI